MKGMHRVQLKSALLNARSADAAKLRVLFVQGAGAGAHAADAKLVASLKGRLGPEYEVHYPVMPNESNPDNAAWQRFLTGAIVTMGDGAILVGHSAGATSLIMALTKLKSTQKIAGIFLIAAPYGGAEGWQIEGFELPAKMEEWLPPGVPMFLYHGREDAIVPFTHVDLFARTFPQAFVRRLDDRNHQLNDDLSEVADDIRSYPGR
jgi:hypothetical protein